MKIEIISGTNRNNSRTQRLSEHLCDLYRSKGIQADVIDLKALPMELFTPTAYATKPKEFESFASRVLAADGLIVVVPEYNGSFPGILKLFIDMLPFPESFQDKHVSFVGLAAGYFGGLRAVEQLQMVFAYRNAKQHNQRVFVPKAAEAIDPEQGVLDQTLRRRLGDQAEGFIDFCTRGSNA